jgi:hypothetical protein
VSNDFDAGEQVVYNPPKVLASFDPAVRGTGSRHRQSSGSLPDANNLGPQAQSRATTYAPPGTALPDHELTEVHPHDHLQLERRNKEDANGRDEAQSGWSSTSLIVTGALLVGGSARVAPATPNSPLIPAINARTSCSLRTQRATPTSTVPRDGRMTGGGGRTTGNRAFLTRLLPVRKRAEGLGQNTDSPDLKLRAIAVCRQCSR